MRPDTLCAVRRFIHVSQACPWDALAYASPKAVSRCGRARFTSPSPSPRARALHDQNICRIPVAAQTCRLLQVGAARLGGRDEAAVASHIRLYPTRVKQHAGDPVVLKVNGQRLGDCASALSHSKQKLLLILSSMSPVQQQDYICRNLPTLNKPVSHDLSICSHV